MAGMMAPLNYGMPYGQRSHAWENQRQTIVDRRLTGTAAPADVEFVEAIRDMAGQLKFEMDGLTMKQEEQLERTERDLEAAKSQILFYQEELRTSREAYTKMLAVLTKTTEANAKVTNDLWKAIDVVRTSTATTTEAGPSRAAQRPGTFTVKPKSIDTFSGEKTIAAVYS